MGSQLFRDQVDLAVIELPADFLVKEQIVIHRVKAPQGGQNLFRLHIGIVGSRRHILILSDLLEKASKAARRTRVSGSYS